MQTFKDFKHILHRDSKGITHLRRITPLAYMRAFSQPFAAKMHPAAKPSAYRPVLPFVCIDRPRLTAQTDPTGDPASASPSARAAWQGFLPIRNPGWFSAFAIAVAGRTALFAAVAGDEFPDGFVAGILRRKVGLGRTTRDEK